jgi:hypothetical protein
LAQLPSAIPVIAPSPSAARVAAARVCAAAAAVASFWAVSLNSSDGRSALGARSW